MSYSTITTYEGKGRCTTTHNATGKSFSTDLHKSIGGLEENPSPGEMLAATLASCMMSNMSVVAARKEIDVQGMTIEASPVTDANNKILKIELKITMPLPEDHPQRKMFEQAAATCPVHQALNPSVETPVEWSWS